MLALCGLSLGCGVGHLEVASRTLAHTLVGFDWTYRALNATPGP